VRAHNCTGGQTETSVPKSSAHATMDVGSAFSRQEESLREGLIPVQTPALLGAFPAGGIADYLVIFRKF